MTASCPRAHQQDSHRRRPPWCKTWRPARLLSRIFAAGGHEKWDCPLRSHLDLSPRAPVRVQKVYAPRQQESTVFRRIKRSVGVSKSPCFLPIREFPAPWPGILLRHLGYVDESGSQIAVELAPRASARVVVHAIGLAVLLGKVRGKWGLAPWPEPAWPQRDSVAGHGAFPLFRGASRETPSEKGTGTVASDAAPRGQPFEATEPVPIFREPCLVELRFQLREPLP